MKQILRNRWTMLLALPLLTAMACSVPGSGAPSAAAIAAPTAAVTVQENRTFGSGSFSLTDPQTGLSQLASYTASLSMSFSGTKGGQPYQWSRKYTMLASKDPALRQLTIASNGGAKPTSVVMAEMDGVDYQASTGAGCTAAAVEAGSALADRLEPAGFLHYVIGAETAGSQTVNGVAADHYTFDERALGEQNLNQSKGEVWVATSGGYVARYTLTTKATADYFGGGIEGTLTWDYELTNAGKPLKIQLPADCPGGMIDAPLVPNASNVTNVPGLITYTTSMGIADVAAFYQQQLPGLGWTLQGQADVTSRRGLMEFLQSGQDLSLLITSNAGVTSVNMLLQRAQQN